MAALRSVSCRAILFDLDGVLVDSAECVERTWRKWATDHELDPERVIAVAHGRRTLETVRMVAPQLSAEAELATLAASESTTSEGVYEIAGARELLEQPPDDCVVIEDAPAGIESARAAGMRVIAITTTFERESLKGADAVIERLTDLTVVLNRDQIQIGISAGSR
jgi:sugar-phosphatase